MIVLQMFAQKRYLYIVHGTAHLTTSLVQPALLALNWVFLPGILEKLYISLYILHTDA